MLPQCLGNFTDTLLTSNLRSNNSFGSIPNTFLIGDRLLMMIDLSDNLLEGRIPRSLGNCTRLEFLALRNNQLDDAFFIFVGSSFKVEKILSYFNNLNGAISEPTSHLGFSIFSLLTSLITNLQASFHQNILRFGNWNNMKKLNCMA